MFTMQKLSATAVKQAQPQGASDIKSADGGGLFLLVKPHVWIKFCDNGKTLSALPVEAILV